MTRYTHQVVIFRWTLILAMLGLVLTAVIWAWPKAEPPILAALPPKNELAAPRFVIKQGAFTHVLTGSKANYSADQQIVNLQNAKLEAQDDKQLITITTPEGIYNKQTAQIALNNGVVLTASTSQLHLQAAQGQVDTQKHIVQLQNDVQGATPTMQIQSNTADYLQDQQIIHFRGHVHVILQP